MRVSDPHAIARTSMLTFAAVATFGGGSFAALGLGACAFDPSGIESSAGDDEPADHDAALDPGAVDAGATDALAQAPDAAAGSCRPGWSERDTSCYFVSPGALSWSEARAFCEDLDAHLVIVEDDGENQLLRQLSSDGLDWWLGASDALDEGTWSWVDDTTATFMPWAFLQPDNLFDEDCLLQQSNGAWNDVDCARAFVFVCEHALR